LKETAIYRLEYPTLSIKELGELFTPVVGKSGMNHRLRKLSQIAEELRNNQKD
jgi:DNA-binding protein WhiA